MAAPVTKYTLTATIGQADIPILKDGNYKLCVAKFVNGRFNVVWEGRDFLSYNVFEFTDEFQVFGTAAVVPGNRVYASTNQSNIKYGQTATLDRNGVMSSATGGPDQSGKFKVINNYGQIYFGVAAKTQTGTFTPIYAATTPTVRGETTFTPVSKVLIFFSNELSTGTIFVDSISDTLEVDFTGGVKKVDVTYMTDPNSPTGGNGAWIVNGSSVSLTRVYHTLKNTFTTKQPSAALLKKIDIALNSDTSNVVPVVRGAATFAFRDANALARAQAATAWLGANQPADGITQVSNVHLMPNPVAGQYRVRVDIGLDSTNSTTPSLDKGRIEPGFRVFCEQVLDDPVKRYDTMTIQWAEEGFTMGYARSVYNNNLDATNAVFSLSQYNLPAGVHFYVITPPFGPNVDVTTYFVMDQPSAIPSQDHNMIRGLYDLACGNPNYTGITWYTPPM